MRLWGWLQAYQAQRERAARDRQVRRLMAELGENRPPTAAEMEAARELSERLRRVEDDDE